MALTPEQTARYARHIVLREIGGAGQNSLLRAKVAIIGAGGLGGPAGLYLAAAGIGEITLIDDDIVELSNLQRQIQFSDDDLDKDKSKAMAQTLSARAPHTKITPQQVRLTSENAMTILKGHDVILDGTDNFATRLGINKASRALNIPLVSGAIGRFEMQLGVFNTGNASPCYQCFVGDIEDTNRNCASEGVLGAIAGMCGSMMAMEAIKLITGTGSPLSSRLYIFDALTAEGRTLNLKQDANCPVCH